MPNVIDRSRAEALIREQVVSTIFQDAPKQSVVMQLGRKLPNMTSKQTRIPVLSMLPLAYWVNGDTGYKQTSRQAWENVYLTAGELAVIVPIPEAVLADAEFDILGEVMGLKYDARLDLSALSDALEKRGLTPGGRVQKAVDEAVIRYCDPKVPFRTGTLKHSAITASAIGDGMIVYATPYARYLYYGEVYGPNIPIFEDGELAGFFSPPHKYPTGRPLTYNGAPDRGAYWFERAMAEHKDDVIREAAALAGGRPGK